jgi:hypothetical protein
MRQMWDVETAQIAPLHPCELVPEALARVQLWGIGWQALQMEALRCTVREELPDGVAAVDWRAIPEDDQAAGYLTPQVLQEGDDIRRVERAVLTMEIQLSLRRDSTDGREMITGTPLPQDGRLAHRGIGPDDTRQGVEPRFIYKEDGLALGFCPFVMARQVSSRQCAMAASSRCRARRAGCCGLQRITASRRPT